MAHHEAYHDLPPRVVFATMTGVVAAMLLAALDQTIVGTAMPRIISDLHGFQHYSGVLTAYMVAATTAVPIAGKLSDFYGRKFFLLMGVTLFIVASVLCGGAQSMAQLITFRGIQGLGAGITQSMAFTTIADLFPPARRGRVTGIMGAVFGFASVVGPAVGGFLTDGPGWRYVFYVNLPIGVIAILILIFFFPHIKVKRKAKPKIDYAGAISLVLWVVPLLLALSWGGRDYAWNSLLIRGFITGAIIMLGVFFYIETKASEPIVPLTLFKNKVIWTSMSAALIVAMGMFGTTLFIPLFIQAVIGTSATKSGAVMMPLTLSLILCSIASGQIITKIGRYRVVAIVGVFLNLLGMFLLSRMDATTHYYTVVRNMIVMGLGLGATMPVFNLAVQNAVEVKFVGAITATVQFVRSIGGSLGAAVFGSVLANQFAPAFYRSLPPHYLDVIPMEQLKKLENPQSLLHAGDDMIMKKAFEGFGQNATAMIEAVKVAAKIGLTEALHRVFMLGTFLLMIGVVIAFMLKDLPLRKTNKPESTAMPIE